MYLINQINHTRSRLARALWIEIGWFVRSNQTGRSRLARALWIEIVTHFRLQVIPGRRGSREPCGLKSETVTHYWTKQRRGSREPCGLKSNHTAYQLRHIRSRLARALWIEIIWQSVTVPAGCGRGSREPCGLKFLSWPQYFEALPSRLARALWIEITVCVPAVTKSAVEARESLVD